MDTYSTYSKKKMGYQDVSETVKTLEKIAAGQLHSIQKNTAELALYNSAILPVLERLHSVLTSDKQTKSVVEKSQRTLLVVLSGDKGLVGEMWRKLFNICEGGSNQDLLIIGKKGQKNWPVNGGKIRHYNFTDRIPTRVEVDTLSDLLDGYFTTGLYQSISVAYLKSDSLSVQLPLINQLLPINVAEITEGKSTAVSYNYPIIETPLNVLKEKLHKKYLSSRLLERILETAVSEFSARTVSMEHASMKTDEISDRLTMVYSRGYKQLETQKQLERFVANKSAI